MRLGVSTILAFVLSGCVVVTYQMGGVFEDSGQTFHGSIAVTQANKGTLRMVTEDGTLVCEGTTLVTKMASAFSAIGATAVGFAKCNDGRSFKFDFLQTAEYGGYAQGIDDRGNIVRFFYDTDEDIIRNKIKEAKLEELLKE